MTPYTTSFGIIFYDIYDCIFNLEYYMGILRNIIRYRPIELERHYESIGMLKAKSQVFL